jgi:hypothetical protein
VRDLFKDLRVSTDGFSKADLAQTTLDWAIAESGDRRAIVYRLPNGNNRPHFIVGYKNGSAKWIHREVPAEMGSPLDVQFLENRLIVPSHLSPSAGTIAVLGTDLSLKATYGGFLPVAVAPDLVVIGRNLVHFAPAHPEALAVIDLKTNRLAPLYPSDANSDLSQPAAPSLSSPARRAYRDALAPLFAAAAKSRGVRSYGWDPDWFNVEIDRTTFRYDATSDTLEFTAQFTTDAIPDGPVAVVLVTCTTMHSAKRSCVEHDGK